MSTPGWISLPPVIILEIRDTSLLTPSHFSVFVFFCFFFVVISVAIKVFCEVGSLAPRTIPDLEDQGAVSFDLYPPDQSGMVGPTRSTWLSPAQVWGSDGYASFRAATRLGTREGMYM